MGLNNIHRSGPRIVVVCAVLIIVSIWISVGLHAQERHNSIFAQAEKELVGAVATLNSHARRTVDSVNTTLRAVDSWLHETSLQTRLPPLASINNLIADLQKTNEDAVEIRPITLNGTLFRFEDDGQNFRTYVGDREYIKALDHEMAGALYISTPTYSRESNRLIWPIAIKTHSNSYGISHLVAAVTIKQFEAAYKDLLISAPATIGIARDTGELLVSVPVDPESIGKVIDGFGAIPTRHNNVLSGVADVPQGDDIKLTAYAFLSRQPLVVFINFSRADLRAVWISEVTPQVIAATIATIFAILIAGWLRHLMRLKDLETLHVRSALEEANAANKTKRQFLANMSHELRTPLNAIIGFSDVIGKGIFGPLDAHYRAYGNDINDSGKLLLRMVDQLLDISRVEAGAVAINLQPCDLVDAIEDAMKVVQPICSERKIKPRVDIAEDARRFICDRGVLSQVMINILSNAGKYNKDGGQIMVSSHKVPDGLKVVVADTGRGIPAAELDRVFEPFSRGNAWVAKAAPGTGLGLSIVRGLMEFVHGHVSLKSTEGVGTTVELFFPVAEDRRLAASGLAGR